MFALLLITLVAISSAQAIYTEDYYTAAVLEHVKVDEPTDRPAAILRNLATYHQAASQAHTAGADIIVFPEEGIMPSAMMTSKNMEQFFEVVPEPGPCNPDWNPCLQSTLLENLNGTDCPVVTRLSCIAKEFGLYLAANIGEKVICSPENDTDCPTQVRALFYNTDVVFDGNGTLVARHRKRFLFFEAHKSRPKFPEYTVFKTAFGSFGVVICFDTLFSEAVELIEKFKVENMIISTWWFDELPFLTALEFFQGWALGNNVNVLVANIHEPHAGSIGSLIVSRISGALNYTFQPTRTSSELLISRVPRRNTYQSEVLELHAIPETSDYQHTATDMSNYTLVKLESANGSIEACHNGLCCRLHYTSQTVPANFFLGAFNGIRNVRNRYYFCQEICLVVLCANGSQCKSFPTHSETVFQTLTLAGNISTPHQYPFVFASGMRLIPKSQWQFSLGNINLNPGMVEEPLLTVGLHGRCYHRDPPFPEGNLI